MVRTFGIEFEIDRDTLNKTVNYSIKLIIHTNLPRFNDEAASKCIQWYKQKGRGAQDAEGTFSLCGSRLGEWGHNMPGLPNTWSGSAQGKGDRLTHISSMHALQTRGRSAVSILHSRPAQTLCRHPGNRFQPVSREHILQARKKKKVRWTNWHVLAFSELSFEVSLAVYSPEPMKSATGIWSMDHFFNVAVWRVIYQHWIEPYRGWHHRRGTQFKSFNTSPNPIEEDLLPSGREMNIKTDIQALHPSGLLGRETIALGSQVSVIRTCLKIDRQVSILRRPRHS